MSRMISQVILVLPKNISIRSATFPSVATLNFHQGHLKGFQPPLLSENKHSTYMVSQ